MDIKRIRELRAILEAESISYDELHEIQVAAELAGIGKDEEDEMMAGDQLDELERLATA